MQNLTPVPQSLFVTVLAWILVVFGGLSILGALMQNVMINIMMPSVIMNQSANGQPMPEFPIGIFRIIGVLFLALTSFVTYAAYSLLKRRNWARRTFIVLFACGIIVNIVWAIAFGLGAGFSTLPTTGEHALPLDMRTMFKVMTMMFVIFSLVMSCLFGWIIKRLHSPVIKAEFNSIN